MSAQLPAGELYVGPLGAELARRVLDATNAARALLGARPPLAGVVGPEEVAELIAALAAALGEGAGELEAHRQGLDRVRRRYEARSAAIARVHAATAALAAVDSPEELLAQAPAALARASSFERVVLSLVRAGATLHTETVHLRGDREASAAMLARLRAEPVRLAPPLVEAEMLRRRRATVVSEAQLGDRAHRPLAVAMGWTSYVAAAVFVRGSAVALIHADRGAGGEVDPLDRDVLWEFAEGLAGAYERASLARTLASERARLARGLDWLAVQAAELADGSLEALERGRPPPRTRQAPRRSDDRAVFDGVLTRRQLDVLRLLAGGLSNRAIAAELVVSEGTVRFHTGAILRKLDAANRAQAAARYLALTGRAAVQRDPGAATRSAPV